jgi:C_GCAxxG_C_C family probable redox protein
MSKGKLLAEIEERAFTYSQEYKACSQCTLLAIQEVFGLTNDDVLKAATGFAGGIGRTGSVCGALSGGVMALGLLYGRDGETSIICDDIEVKLFGRSFDKWNPEERKEKARLGGYEGKCPTVVGKATRWAAELILEEQEKTD